MAQRTASGREFVHDADDDDFIFYIFYWMRWHRFHQPGGIELMIDFRHYGSWLAVRIGRGQQF